MLKFSIYYPFSEEAHFNTDYYLKTHITLVQSALEGMGMARLEVVLGRPGMMNRHPHFFAVANLYFDEATAMAMALKATGVELSADIPNFTDVSPIQEISEVITTN